MNWNLSRPKPALPASYFWTWDMSANFMLDDPGMVNFGCENRYLKRPETYGQDYQHLTDMCAGLGIPGIVIYGFLRDDHGGIEAARRVADYGMAKGVKIMPGIGTAWYGGIYYEGDHPYNIECFLRDHPDAAFVTQAGEPTRLGICPTHPHFTAWLQEAMQWLFREFAIGGVNLENGDFIICHCPRCQNHREQWPAGDPDFFRLQALSYEPAVEAIAAELDKKLITWATYTGFRPGGEGKTRWTTPYMYCQRPALVDRVRPESVAQWTISGMLQEKPLPLSAWLDEGAPEAAFDNPHWPRDLRPPNRRSVGLIHQGSQWDPANDRYSLILSTIKEGCLRAARAGLEGVSIVGELTPLHIPAALNYLAFSHFIHWPEDTLRQFGRETMGQALAGADEGETFVEFLAAWDAKTLSEAQKKEIEQRTKDIWWKRVVAGHDLDRWRFWDWLNRMASGVQEKFTATFF